jgi:hypothetical protein
VLELSVSSQSRCCWEKFSTHLLVPLRLASYQQPLLLLLLLLLLNFCGQLQQHRLQDHAQSSR